MWERSGTGRVFMVYVGQLLWRGAQISLMSLWKVSDAGTQYLMTHYYKDLKKKKNKHEALREVQLKMLKKRKYSHPFYWASFTLSGDWRAID